ncbi:proteasome assembly chaperone 4-like [Tupaia chinensis]|uniref:proteasome assembly chaperone 4-like n=1 Tax=Tupaia chinensis TaxID=246437 RepID=UPI0003C8D125|nr:proteasome assembly chaperone 4-like [Tupaia chinensis]
MEGPQAAVENVFLHNFSARLWEQLIHLHCTLLSDSALLVGATLHLRKLDGPMCSCFDSIPVSSSLLRDASHTTSTGLAQRLARKTNKQAFVSYNLPNTDGNFALLAENRIKEETEAFPKKF